MSLKARSIEQMPKIAPETGNQRRTSCRTDETYVYGPETNAMIRIAATNTGCFRLQICAWIDRGISFSSAEVPWAGKAPFYPGVDWSKPTPFMRKMMA